jgi:hypothetical protein
MAADFNSGTQGAWFVGTAIESAEAGQTRAVSAVFFRHEIVVHIDLTLTTDSYLPTMTHFAREQFSTLP